MALCLFAALSGMVGLAQAADDIDVRAVSGVLAAANGQVTAQTAGDADAPLRQLDIGSKLFFEDEVVTADGVQAQILLRDGTTFSIGENAQLVLDAFVYDPASDEGAVGAVIKRGAFRFISGKIAKKQPRNMKVLAGNTAIAIRGTEVIGTVESGSETVILLSGQIDLQSTAGDCGQQGAQTGSDMFGIGRDGQLEFNAAISEAPPSFCQQSLVRAGFGVQVAPSGIISTPTRVDQIEIDAVIDATIVRQRPASPEEKEASETEESPPEDDVADDTAERDDEKTVPIEDDAEKLAATRENSDDDKNTPESGASLQVQAANSFVEADAPDEKPASDFDKVVMRAFGRLDPSAEDDGKGNDPVIEDVAMNDLAQNDPEKAQRDADADSDDGKGDIESRAPAEDLLEDSMKREADAIEEGERKLSETKPEEGGASGNNAPVLAAISAVSLTDSSADDNFSDTDGTLSASDADSGDTITYALAGSSASNAVSGFTHARQGTYGLMLLNSATGAYRFEPEDSSLEALSSNTSESYNFTASDGSLSASQTLTVNISSTNDGPSAIDTMALAAAGGTQNTGTTGLRVGVVTDPEGDTVTDISSSLNTLPAWLSFSNQTLGNGSVEYYWEVGANTLPWLNGSNTTQLKARSSGVDSTATTIAITFSCQSSHCNDFLQSTNAVTSPVLDDATNINAVRSTGVKSNDVVYAMMTASQRDALFDTGTAATGTFRQIYTSAETGSGSPSGSWTFNQLVSANYQTRVITLTSNVSANNLTYFDGASDDFSYVSTINYSDLQAGTTAIFEKQINSGSATGYNLVNGNSANVDVTFTDQIGFLQSGAGVKAAIINTGVNPHGDNPVGYKDDTREMVQREWRALEPQ